VINWPDAIPKLRQLRDHWQRRVRRMETVAFSGRADWSVFGEKRAYAQGKRDALLEAFRVIDEHVVLPDPADMVVVELARQGLGMEQIAGRCGMPVGEVAAALARYVQASEAAGAREEPRDEVVGFEPPPYSPN
jgi:DNA-directed RNA polymerase specialized sigma24 family protein